MFRAQNTINGKEGRLFVNGEEVAYVKNLDATVEKAKSDVPIIGRRWMGKKSTGVSGSGTLTLYKVTSKFVQSMLRYAQTGEDEYFTFQEVVDDKGSGRGVERTTLYDVNIDSAKLGKLNVEDAVLEEEVPFTFEGADLPESLRDSF